MQIKQYDNMLEIKAFIPEPSYAVMEMYNLQGNKIFEQSFGLLTESCFNKSLRINNLPCGLYIVIIRTGKIIFREKVIISR